MKVFGDRHAAAGVSGALTWTRSAVRAALLLGSMTVALLAALLVSQVLPAWRGMAPAVGPLGARYGVFLSSGQVFYGVLLEQNRAYMKLGDVYYVQAYKQADGQTGNRLVSRQKTDWHGPDWQSIPTDKIVMVESVGAQSQLARLIEQDRTLPKRR